LTVRFRSAALSSDRGEVVTPSPPSMCSPRSMPTRGRLSPPAWFRTIRSLRASRAATASQIPVNITFRVLAGVPRLLGGLYTGQRSVDAFTSSIFAGRGTFRGRRSSAERRPNLPCSRRLGPACKAGECGQSSRFGFSSSAALHVVDRRSTPITMFSCKAPIIIIVLSDSRARIQ
jgi:hypothetical protein